ncbi:MAG: Cof-type HAD-IIB family hydrolase [Armatimonadota bacterium]|nr:Cof-type HAD-IIB family hydrolase [Armatimonadota bacterium]
MRYRLLVADIDGTLVNAQREITAPVRDAVRAAQAQGVRVCLATGRIWPSARRFVEGLGADPPAILYNGALVYDFARDEVWLRRALPAEHARAVLRLLRRHQAVQPHLYVDDRVYIGRMNEITAAYQQKDSLQAEAVGDLADWLSTDPMKILIIGPPAALAAVVPELDALPFPVNHVFSEATYLEVLPPGVSKGEALRAAATHLGVAREEIIAVGDNLNDLAMVEYAGLGVAMANAPDALRARADYVAPSNDEGGLGEVIERFILSRARRDGTHAS